MAAAKEREALGRNYTKGSDWYQHNKDNPEALAVARAAGRGRAADGGDQRPRRRAGLQDQVAGEPEGHARSSRSARSSTRTAAELYEKYLAAYPNSKRSYEFSAFYADALYYSGQLPAGDRRLQDRARLAASTTGTRKTPPSG